MAEVSLRTCKWVNRVKTEWQCYVLVGTIPNTEFLQSTDIEMTLSGHIKVNKVLALTRVFTVSCCMLHGLCL